MQANFHSLLMGPKFHLCWGWMATTTRKGKANLQSQEFVKPHDKSPCWQLKKRQWSCLFSSSICIQTGEWPCSPSTWVGPWDGAARQLPRADGSPCAGFGGQANIRRILSWFYSNIPYESSFFVFPLSCIRIIFERYSSVFTVLCRETCWGNGLIATLSGTEALYLKQI